MFYRLPSRSVDASTATFGTSWSVSGATGLKTILIAAQDSGNLEAENNGATVGTIELITMIGFEVKNGSGEAVTSISFPAGSPGTSGLFANENPIEVRNIGGVAIDVYILATPMSNGNDMIPVSSVRVEGTSLSSTKELIAQDIQPGASSFLNISVDYPAAIPAGIYRGTITFEVAG